MGYQSIHDQGASNSVGKLKALCFPKMHGKSFLDVGCNEGFFCGAALAAGASRVVGIDADYGSISAARTHFSKAEFIQSDWEVWLTGNSERFDFILCASAIHYAKDQTAFLSLLLSKLAPFGTLILECGLGTGSGETVVVPRWDGPKTYFTKSHIQTLCESLGYRVMLLYPSVDQRGDAVPRFVLHITRPRRSIILNFGIGDSGKTVLGQLLQQRGIGWLGLDFLAQKTGYDQPEIFKSRLGNIAEYWTLYERLHMQDSAVEKIIAALPDGDPIYVEGLLPPTIITALTSKLTEMGFILHRITESAGTYNRRHQHGVVPLILLDGSYFLTSMPSSIESVKIENGYILIDGWVDKKLSANPLMMIAGQKKVGADVTHIYDRNDAPHGVGITAGFHVDGEASNFIRKSGLRSVLFCMEDEGRQLRKLDVAASAWP